MKKIIYCVVLSHFNKFSETRLSGTAGAVKWGAVLFHGTLLVSSNPEVIEELLDAPRPLFTHSRFVRSMKKPMVNLEQALSRKVTLRETKDPLRKGFERAFRIRLVPGTLTPEENTVFAAFYEKDPERYVPVGFGGLNDAGENGRKCRTGGDRRRPRRVHGCIPGC